MALSDSPFDFPTVTQEQFNVFHHQDRLLYTRLVFNLGREPAESMQVMALWMWLEHNGRDYELVKNMLDLTNTLINALADESVLCMNCIESDEFHGSADSNDVPLIQSLTRSGVSLKFFHDNRLAIIRGVTKFVNDVCARAFKDILQQALDNKFHFIRSDGDETIVNGATENIKPVSFYGPLINPLMHVLYYNSGVGAFPQMRNSGPVHHHVPQFLGPHVFDPYDLGVQRQFQNSEISEVLSRIQISGSEEEKEVPQDDRTIFLTFSKGYPISENELRDFFTENFGDFIDVIHMQEVPQSEQPLYARLVTHSASNIEVVLDGKTRAKFTINGKHVWARKYVRKNHKLPQQSTPPKQPSSPAAAVQP